MNFRQRLNRYLIGVALGLVLVAIFFGGRDWLGWTPNSVVLKKLNASGVKLTQLSQCQMACYDLTKEDLDGVLASGNVAFDKSQVKLDPKVYVIEMKGEEDVKDAYFFEMHENNSILLKMETNREQPCSCE
jgi:hypothetical protein